MGQVKERIRLEQTTIVYEDTRTPEVEYYIFAGTDNEICALTYEPLKVIGGLIDRVIYDKEKGVRA